MYGNEIYGNIVYGDVNIGLDFVFSHEIIELESRITRLVELVSKLGGEDG